MDSFAWRISVATISQAGPFSAFPGIDRQIMLLDGDGVQLVSAAAGIDHALQQRWQPFAFSGDVALDCSLLGGTSTDFNVMTRRGQWSAEVSIHDAAVQPGRGAAGLCLVLQGGFAQGQTVLQAGVQEAEDCEDAYLLFGYLSLAELAAAQGEHEQGEQLLRRAERRMHWLHVPEVRYREMLQLAQGNLSLRLGEAEQARQAFQRVRQRLEQERLLAPSGFYDLLPRARLCQAQADLALGEQARALQALQQLHDDCRHSGHHSLATQVRLSQAEALHLSGREDEAEALLRIAVAEAERQQQVLPLLALQQRQPDWLEGHPAWPQQLLQRTAESSGAAHNESLLSKRELAVLGLIAQGHSNQQIAEQLYISLHTVKTHARRINVKLGVQRRTQAVARAKAEGWLG